tara:strand:- start:93671 stop:95095 length:1425 start_codon:yes stop_codon:yes gene_type:complete
MKKYKNIILATIFMPLVTLGAANTHAGIPHLDGSELNIFWVIPFAGILLSIAAFPLLAPHFWHHNFGKVSFFWAIGLILPFIAIQGLSITIYELLHVGLLEYVPFIILLLALFTISGGVCLKGSLVGTPLLNTCIIFIGTILASWMGTTGAAMLLIRPLIRANAFRENKVHIVVFFIFLVANIGGSLTPLGDPPLFLGFLKGVDFFWTTTAMLMPMIFMVSTLLIIFFGIDSYFYKKEPKNTISSEDKEKLSIEGTFNLLLLAGVVFGVLLSGFWKPGIYFELYHVKLELQNIMRDLLLLSLTYASWTLTSIKIRKSNEYTWFPIVEVAKLFAGIFITIIPAIAILKAGKSGALSSIITSVSSESGEPINYMYFWLTGILSSFLDNAPTYLVFFNTAGGDPSILMGDLSNTLLAISAGAVFMGANTYIGNAPNFMVKSIAESSGVEMPSFFGYLIKWSFPILVPLFIVVTYLFF